ncbi:MAG TPA: cysteine peptidase family C39 domain-containing protein [Gemmatimonadales bacterium]|nr:cysteine peptidase family C39 domain-containing protein [Gemmatimonadales bacterium]
MRAIARLVTAGLWFTTGLGGASALAQSSLSGHSTAQPAGLDVPYLPQSVLLCGGAALAMVERWWGRRGVYAQDFATLVRPALGGILTTDLASAAGSRGWDTSVLRGTPELVRENLRGGVPVVALIEVARDRYHYVVVLGWSNRHVVFHDPAGAPFTRLDEAKFLTRWTGADRWALVIRPAPAAAVTASVEGTPPAPADSMPCSPWLDQALDAVAANRLDDAARLLAEAGQACPAEPMVLRELAGVRFKQGRHAEVIRLAAEYLALVPGDGHGWELLATSRYLTGDRDGALDAWNQVGRPIVDLVRIDGARGIRFQGIAGSMSVPHGTVLTRSRLALARRRLADVPALRRAAVEYQPVRGGIVEVRVAVVERPVVERAWYLVAAGAIRAIAQNEVGLEIASPTGAGELWTANWRWEPARPRAAFRVDMPVDLGVQGVIGIEGAWERFRFGLDTATTTVSEETRRSAVVGFGGWVTVAVHPSAGLRLERWSGNRHYLAASVGAELRARDNRFALIATSEYAVALSTHPSYARGGTRARWASSLGLGRAAWSAQFGFDWASPHAPLGTWPVAGGNLSWMIPLRAHPLTGGGLLSGRSAGRGIIHAGIAGDHPVYRIGPLVLAAGVFLDGAEVIAAADGSPTGRFYLDGGAGIRIGIAEGQLGVLRIDLARGLLADRGSALTVGVHRSWPPFKQGVRGDDPR